MSESRSQNCVYILRCADGSLYTGWTNRLEARLAVHQAGKGARYTRGRLPIELVHVEFFASKSEAMKREVAIKKLGKREKEAMIRKSRL